MTMSPGSRRRDTRTVPGDQPQDPASLDPMQEPLGSMEWPISRTSDGNDVNLATGRTTDTRNTVMRDRGRGFTTTFAIVAAVLVAAFLVALYLGSDRMNQATAPVDSQAPVADSAPGTTNDTTGSTTAPAEPQETAPAPATGTNTGGGTTAPANP
jgi:hypothetical protein